MTAALWTLIFMQMAMGAFDTLYHHEGTERLAWRPDQAGELRLHGIRNLAYAAMFLLLGWSEPRGLWALGLIALMAGELVITLWDFVEEDRTRRLPPTERVLHTLLTLNYGAVLAFLLPWLAGLAAQPSGLSGVNHGWIGWLCLLAALGVMLSGLRDLAAAQRCPRLRHEDPIPLADGLSKRTSVLVTGGTGFIGQRLVAAFVGAGHEVIVLSRSRVKALALAEAGPVRLVTSLNQIAAATRIDAIVNLAGEPLSDSPWTRAKRLKILISRLTVTYDLLRLIRRLEMRPEVLVSGSAIGWYGLRGDEILAEGASGSRCFSQRICAAWERAAIKAERLGLRVVRLRIGLVLDRDGGMLARMLTPFEFGLGGPFGNGKQWMSWIHRDDLVRLIVHCIATPSLAGPVNGVAPAPVVNAEFALALGRALRRPAILRVPGAPLRLLLGGFAEELLLSGQRVAPRAALRSGFQFRYQGLDVALAAIVGRGPCGHGQLPTPEPIQNH